MSSDSQSSSSDSNNHRNAIANVSIATENATSSSARPNRDPTSHRLIEKRRRDRMNNCLSNLSKLIPPSYMKKGRGRVEKTEIIEMAIEYMKQVQEDPRSIVQRNQAPITPTSSDQNSIKPQSDSPKTCQLENKNENLSPGTLYKEGFYDCITETLRFFFFIAQQNSPHNTPVTEDVKNKLIAHLKAYTDKLVTQEKPATIAKHTAHANNEPKTADTMAIPADTTSFSDQPLNMSLKRPKLSQSNDLPIADMRERKLEGIEEDGVQLFPSCIRSTSSLARSTASLAVSGATATTCTILGAEGSTTSSHYPSSPGGSSRSFTDQSTTSLHGNSPPRITSPPPTTPFNNHFIDHQNNNGNSNRIPAFALHESGQFYVPVQLNANDNPTAPFSSTPTAWFPSIDTSAQQQQPVWQSSLNGTNGVIAASNNHHPLPHPITIHVQFSQQPQFTPLR